MAGEELKSIKIGALTHARLSIISSALGKTIGEVIDDLMVKAYPNLIEETDKVLNDMESIRRITQKPRAKK
jgi:hypothetical protein